MTEPTKKDRSGNSYLVWFDTEYSGLELETASLLQVAALITGRSLSRVLPPEMDIRLAIRLPQDTAVSPWVEENLPDLIAICRSERAFSLEEADLLLSRYVDAVAGPPHERENLRPLLAGNSIHADWWLARKYLPLFSNRLHYRHLDVTTLKIEWQERFPNREFDKEAPENIRRFFPEACFSPSDTRHDAYYDIQASIAELSFYRRHLFSTENK